MSEPAAQSPNSGPWWVWADVLGLYAVATALVWMKLFAWSCRARMSWEEYAVLGSVVWILYMAERIIDGLVWEGLRQERHTIAARRWRGLLSLILALSAGSALLLLYRIPQFVSMTGLKLGAGVAVYFMLTWVIRKNLAGLTGGLVACGCMAVALMQGNLLRMDPGAGAAELWPHLWRGALAGVLLTVVLVYMRRSGAPAPWLLPRKFVSGWIFAMGTALAPFSHLMLWYELLFSPPVLILGAVCAVKSIGIRLVEAAREEQPNFEVALIQRLYPWIMIIVTTGALTEWYASYAIARPLHGAAAAAALLLVILYALRRRISVPLYRALAAAAVIVPAAAAIVPAAAATAFFLKK